MRNDAIRVAVRPCVEFTRKTSKTLLMYLADAASTELQDQAGGTLRCWRWSWKRLQLSQKVDHQNEAQEIEEGREEL